SGTTTRAINIIKVVNGTSTSPSAFTIHLMNPNTEVNGSPQAGSATGTMYMNMSFGSYNISETGGPSGFNASFSGDCSSNGHLVLSASSAATSTCTITNTWATSTNSTTTGSVKVIKLVNGGNATSSNFQ